MAGINYPSTDIKVLTALESIRKRPGLYFGKNKEIIPLAILREALCIPRAYAREGKATRIYIRLKEDGWIDIIWDCSIPACVRLADDKSVAEAWFEDVFGCRDSKPPEHKDLCQIGLVGLTAMAGDMFWETIIDGELYRKSYYKGVSDKGLIGPDKPPVQTEGDVTSISFRLEHEFINECPLTYDQIMGIASMLTEFKDVKISQERSLEVSWENAPLLRGRDE